MKKLALIIAVLSLLGACSKEKKPVKSVEKDPVIAVDTIKLDWHELEMHPRDTFRLVATIVPDNATASVEWFSSSPEFASVDSGGLVTANGEGAAIITCRSGQVEDTCRVTVTNVPVTAVSIDPILVVLAVGESIRFTAKVLPENATDTTIQWSVGYASEDIFRMQDGLVTALGLGENEITATAGNGIFAKATIKVVNQSNILNLPYTEDFESFDDSSIRSSWYFIDADGDGWGWMHNLPDHNGYYTHSGTGVLTSASYDNIAGVLTPDNWAFTPLIHLDLSDNQLVFWALPQDESYAGEHYAVYVTEQISTESATRIFEGRLHCTPDFIYSNAYATGKSTVEAANSHSYDHVTIPIPEQFNGKNVHIAFRHFKVSDMFWLNIDDISVTSNSQLSPGSGQTPDPTPDPAPSTAANRRIGNSFRK
ncbi:MAG: Ig-like domain-containing protein [Bacteroidales bacterium]|nr:Ig-like domain-containing protein [Bacteroidales bacterium]